MGHGDALVDDEPLDLVEHGEVGRVGRLAAEDPPGDDDPDGRFPLLHDPDLDGRGVRPEEQVVLDVERVPASRAGWCGGN